MKGWFKKLLEAIEKANKESFGEKRMDCCDLSKETKNTRKK